MAKNRKFANGRQPNLAVPVGTKSGDPVAVGQIAGVALEDRDSDGTAPVDRAGVYDLSVKGVDGSGNSAVAVGDIIYYTSGDTPKLNKKATGVRYGYALEAITSGATDTIQVALGY